MRIYALVEQVVNRGVTHDEFRGLSTETNVVATWLQTAGHAYYVSDEYTDLKGLCEFFEPIDVITQI